MKWLSSDDLTETMYYKVNNTRLGGEGDRNEVLITKLCQPSIPKQRKVRALFRLFDNGCEFVLRIRLKAGKSPQSSGKLFSTVYGPPLLTECRTLSAKLKYYSWWNIHETVRSLFFGYLPFRCLIFVPKCRFVPDIALLKFKSQTKYQLGEKKKRIVHFAFRGLNVEYESRRFSTSFKQPITTSE